MTPHEMRQEAKRMEALLHSRDVREAMRVRCESQGHDYENGLTVGFQFVRVCAWCGDQR